MELNISVNSASEADSKADSGETEQAAGKPNDLSENGTSNQKDSVQKDSAAQSPGGINTLREEIIGTQEEMQPTPVKIGQTQEKIEIPPEKIEIPQGKIELTPEKIGIPREKIEIPQEKIEIPQEKIEIPREKIGIPREKIQQTWEKIEIPQEKIEIPQEKIEIPQEKIEPEGKMRIPAENKQFRKKISSATTIITQKTENRDDGNFLKENRKLKALLNDFAAPYKIVVNPTDEVIALNDEISFIFSDENTIKNHLISGEKHGVSDRKRQSRLLRDTILRLDDYRSIIEPFISISRRDYLLLFLRVRSELKFRFNKIDGPCNYVNLLLFALANNSFTYQNAPGKVKLSKAYIATMTSILIKIKWIGKHHTGNSRYFCLTDTALQFIKDTVEKKNSV